MVLVRLKYQWRKGQEHFKTEYQAPLSVIQLGGRFHYRTSIKFVVEPFNNSQFCNLSMEFLSKVQGLPIKKKNGDFLSHPYFLFPLCIGDQRMLLKQQAGL